MVAQAKFTVEEECARDMVQEGESLIIDATMKDAQVMHACVLSMGQIANCAASKDAQTKLS